MNESRVLAVIASVTIAFLGCSTYLVAQSAPAASQADSVSIHASLQKSSYAIGEKPIAVLTMENVSSEPVWFPNDLYWERVHVTSKDGEPPKTELHRHLLGDFRPGDGPMLDSGPVAGRSIAPGSLDSQKYDLTGFYDLSQPGDYSVYLEIYDPAGPKDGSGRWLRTNTAHFIVQAAAP